MKAPLRQRYRIRTRIMVWTLAVVLVGLWSFSFLSAGAMKRDVEELLSRQQQSALSLLKTSVSFGLNTRTQVLRTLATQIRPVDLVRPAFLYQALFKQPELLEIFNGGLVMLDQRGVPLVGMPDTALLSPPAPLLDAQALKRVMQQGQPTLGPAIQHSGMGAPALVMAVPIADAQGHVIGALAGLTQLNRPGFLDIVSKGSYGETGGYLLIDSTRRMIITASDPQRMLEQLPPAGVSPPIDRFLQGFSGSQVFTNPRGVEILSSDATLPDTSLLVAVLIPTDEAFAPIRTTQQRLLIGTVMLSLILGLALWWLLERSLAPIMNTTRQLVHMGKAPDLAQALAVPSDDEVGDLVRSFNDLLQSQIDAKTRLQQISNMMARTEAEVHLGSWRWDVGPDVVTWSDELFHIFQLNPSDGAPPFAQHAKLFPPEDMQRLSQAIEATLKHQRPSYEVNLIALRVDGTQRLCVARGYPELDTRGNVTHLFGSFQDVTDLRRAQLELARNTARLQALIDTTLDAVISINSQGQVTEWNPAAERLFGWRNKEVLGRDLTDLIVPTAQRDAHRQGMRRYQGSHQSNVLNQRIEMMALHRDGRELATSLIVLPFQEDNGSFRFTAFITDLTQQHLNQQKLQQLANVFRHASEGITITDADANIVDVNDAFERITGYTRNEAIGQNPRILKSGHQDEAFYQAMWTTLNRSGHWSGEIWNRRKSGEVYPEWLNISAVRDDSGITRQYIGLFTDITLRKEQEHLVQQMAFYDPLTTLPNRRLLLDRLSQAMLACRRDNHFGALMMLDLDNFKPLNDQHGHAAGDALLVEVGRRLRVCVREVDTVARIGGDEFVVLLTALDAQLPSAQEKALAVAEKIRDSLAQPYLVSLKPGDTPISHRCSASIGVVVIQPTQSDQDDALRRADEAMYLAKMQGRNKVSLSAA